MGTSGYSQTNPKHYRVTKRSVRTYVSSKGIEAWPFLRTSESSVYMLRSAGSHKDLHKTPTI